MIGNGAGGDDEKYRTCPQCRRDCEPVPFTADDGHMRISFLCPLHGLHTVIDPFEGMR